MLTVKAILVLRQAQTNIIRHHRNLNMTDWLSYKGGVDDILTLQQNILSDERNECKTTCCLAGFIVLANMEEVDESFFLDPFYVADKAMQIIGTEDVNDIFHEHLWPLDLFDEYIACTTHLDRAKVVCKVIDRFIARHDQNKS